jgi:hypothetical protein
MVILKLKNKIIIQNKMLMEATKKFRSLKWDFLIPPLRRTRDDSFKYSAGKIEFCVLVICCRII